jgi:thioredoxin-like negative regulator of GroEL
MSGQKMIDLLRHQQFEALLRPHRPTEDGFDAQYEPFVCISFSAKWCGPCRRLDKESMVKHSKSVKWYHCDIDTNDVTLGFCGMKSIPSFALIRNGDFVGKLEGPRDAMHVLDWLKEYGVILNN